MTVNDRCFPFGSVRFKVCFLYSSSYYFIFLFVFWRIFAYLVFQIFLFACFFSLSIKTVFQVLLILLPALLFSFHVYFSHLFSIFYLHLSLRFCWICCIFFCCIYIFSLSTTVFHLSITINIFLSTFKSNYLFFIFYYSNYYLPIFFSPAFLLIIAFLLCPFVIAKQPFRAITSYFILKSVLIFTREVRSWSIYDNTLEMKKEEIGGKEKEEDDDYNREDKEKKNKSVMRTNSRHFFYFRKGIILK